MRQHANYESIWSFQHQKCKTKTGVICQFRGFQKSTATTSATTGPCHSPLLLGRWPRAWCHQRTPEETSTIRNASSYKKGDPYKGCAKGFFISSFMNAYKWHVAIMHLCHSFHWFHPSVCCFQCGWHNRGNTANQARGPLVSAMQRNWIFPRPRDLCQSDSASHTSRVTFVSVSLYVIEILCIYNVYICIVSFTIYKHIQSLYVI